MPTTLAMPVLMYLLGKFLVSVRSNSKTVSVTKITPKGPVTVSMPDPLAEKTPGVFTSSARAVLALGATAIGMAYYGFLNYKLTVQDPLVAGTGYYYMAFKDGQFSTINTFLFPFIPLAAFVLALLVWIFYLLASKNKVLNKYV